MIFYYAKSFQLAFMSDSCPIGVPANSCPAGAP